MPSSSKDVLSKVEPSSARPRIRLLGDHSRYHGGSAAAFGAIRAEVERVGELVDVDDDYDLLIVNGEGSMHHASSGFWKKMRWIESALQSKRRVMLVNTVWQSNPQESADVLSRCDEVVAREVLSQKELADQGVEARVCIDQSYHWIVDASAPSVDFGGSIVLTDFWSSEFGGFVKLNSKWAQGFPFLDMQSMSWSSIVNSLKTASLLVTGRHHAVYAACKAEIPFLAMRGNTFKTEGLLKSAESEIPVFSSFERVKELMADGFKPGREYRELFAWMKRQEPWRLKLGVAANG